MNRFLNKTVKEIVDSLGIDKTKNLVSDLQKELESRETNGKTLNNFNSMSYPVRKVITDYGSERLDCTIDGGFFRIEEIRPPMFVKRSLKLPIHSVGLLSALSRDMKLVRFPIVYEGVNKVLLVDENVVFSGESDKTYNFFTISKSELDDIISFVLGKDVKE